MITEYPGEVNNFRRSNWREAVWSRRGIRYQSIRDGLKPTETVLPTKRVGLYMKVLDHRRYNITAYRLADYRLADVKGVRWVS